jgi:hypothetical protein
MNLYESINKQRKMMGLNELKDSETLNEAMFDKLKTNVAGVGSFFTGGGFKQGKLKKQIKFNNRDLAKEIELLNKTLAEMSDKIDSNSQLTSELTGINRANIPYQRYNANMKRMFDHMISDLNNFTTYLKQLDTIK